MTTTKEVVKLLLQEKRRSKYVQITVYNSTLLPSDDTRLETDVRPTLNHLQYHPSVLHFPTYIHDEPISIARDIILVCGHIVYNTH
jgi:hypothetical protein